MNGAACGKVILIGEHAAVYGVPALAAGIDRGVRAHATPAAQTRLRVPAWGFEVTLDASARDDEEPLARAMRTLVAATGGGPWDVEAEVELPPGGGLGCSAALGVAVARAIDPGVSAAELLRRADAWERVFHGSPSGVDAAVAASGGCVVFEKGKGVRPVHVGRPLVLVVGSTGIASSTKSMVDGVARLRERRKAVVDKSFEAIRTLSSNATLAVEAGDVAALGQLLDLCQMLLGGLLVSTPEIEQMCASARKAGAYGAKLTGGGGGGSVIALVEDDALAQRVLSAWSDDGYFGFVTRVERESMAAAVRREMAHASAQTEPAP